MSEDKQKLGTEETEDIIKYADALLDELSKHKADDGKIDTAEIFQTLSNTAPAGVSAVVGAWSVGNELKDLDGEEKARLLNMSFSVVLKIVGLIAGAQPK